MPTKKTASFKALKTTSLECRVWGHAWTHVYTAVEKHSRSRVYVIRLMCARCVAERNDTVSAVNGSQDSRHYKYADGYLIKDRKSWGSRSLFNANSRMELYSRYATGREREGEL